MCLSLSGELLYTPDRAERSKLRRLPSPSELKSKILIASQKLPEEKEAEVSWSCQALSGVTKYVDYAVTPCHAVMP